MGSRTLSHITVLLFLAVWHGFYLGAHRLSCPFLSTLPFSPRHIDHLRRCSPVQVHIRPGEFCVLVCRYFTPDLDSFYSTCELQSRPSMLMQMPTLMPVANLLHVVFYNLHHSSNNCQPTFSLLFPCLLTRRCVWLCVWALVWVWAYSLELSC